MIAPTVHSAVAGVCAPRALHNVIPGGRYGSTWSAPADISCTTFRLGRPARTRPSRSPGTSNGSTTNSTSAADAGSDSPPFHTSALMPSGSPRNISGGSGSHTRVTVPPGREREVCYRWADRSGARRDGGRRAGASEAEFPAAVLRDKVKVVGVLADPRGDVRAEGQHGQAALAGGVKGAAGERASQAHALELVVDLGVNQAEHVPVQAVLHQPGTLAADMDLKLGSPGVIGDDGGVR